MMSWKRYQMVPKKSKLHYQKELEKFTQLCVNQKQ
jgi:hypothetical protein